MGSDHADIQLFFSNRLEILSDALIEQLAKPHSSYLASDTLLVQSRGMSRWLNLRIATRTGIQMNCQYLYPRALIDLLAKPVIECDISGSMNSLTPTTLFWKAYRLLPEWANHKSAFTIRSYLKADSQQTGFLRRYQLAQKVAQLMDQMQIYRPDILAKWSLEREPSNWKSLAWKSIRKSSKQPPFPDLLTRFPDLLETLNSRPDYWPERIHIFGVSSIPPAYLEILKLASRWIPVSLYLTQPSPHYWGDQMSRKKQLRTSWDDEDYSSGHGLLGTLGKQGQDFLNTLIDAEVYSNDQSEHFEKRKPGTLLSDFQNEIYEINPPPKTKTWAKNIESIQVRNCHTIRIEIEVLKDQLHDRFEADSGLTADQVIIMAPNIELYTAAINSVFGRTGPGKDFIPYSIADHSTRSTSPVAFALFRFLELLESRFTANEVVNFLSIPIITDAFGFKQADWDLLRTWIKDTAIRWGINAEQRKSVSDSPFEEYSWTQGIDRWLAGYCIHPGHLSALDNLNPYTEIEGSSATLLTQFLDIWTFLTEAHKQSAKISKTSSWLTFIRECISFLFGRLEKNDEETEAIMNLLNDLHQELLTSESDESMTLKVISQILDERLSQDFRAGTFFTGTVTFCSLKPMRNIPAKFIGLIGMNENAFPRRDLSSEFTQFPDGWRLGDRSLSHDDRYLFLESLLASRDCFYISYLGINSQSLDEQPASIVVEELLDSLDDYYHFPDQQDARGALVCPEALQAFSPRYFKADNPHSFSTDNLIASMALVESQKDESTVFVGYTRTELEIPDEVPLVTFIRFFSNPSRYWLNQSLELNFPYKDTILEDTEPIEPSGLLNYHLGQHLLRNPQLLKQENEHYLKDFLPVGTLRTTAVETIKPSVRRMLASIEEIQTESFGTFSVDLLASSHNIRGVLENVNESHFLQFRFGKLRTVDLLNAWIGHLCICASIGNIKFSTRLIGIDEVIRLSYVDEASTYLEKLGRYFTKGHYSPLPFFPDTAHAYAKGTLHPNTRSKSSPLDKAHYEFSKNADAQFGQPGEAFERHINTCFPHPEDAISKAFETIALEVFEPIFKHRKSSPL